MGLLQAIRDRGLLRVLRLPTPLLRRLAGGAVVREGRTLDAQAQMLVRLADRFAPKTPDMTVDAARRQMDESGATVAGPPRHVLGTEDFDLGGGITARRYVPHDVSPGAPLLVWYHGGGFVTGSLRSHDPPMRMLADEARMPVLSIAYRLAPEHKFPAAVDDAVRAYLWARARAVPSATGAASPWGDGRVLVGGDSAGGNLAAVVCHVARDEGHAQPDLQVLVYPATDFTRALESHRTYAEGYFLDRRTIDYYLDHYGAPERHPRASVLLAERFDELAPAVIHTAGFDPLVDEGDAYAEKLRAAGVPVLHVRHDSLIHGWFNMAGAIEAAGEALRRLASDVHAALELTR